MNPNNCLICQPKLFFKLAAIFGVVLFPCVAVFGVIGSLKGEMFPGSPWMGVVMFGGFIGTASILSLWLLFETFTRYEWDGQSLARCTILGETVMEWPNIQRFRIQRFAGGFVIKLYDIREHCLKVDIQLIGEESPLHLELKKHLAPLMDQPIASPLPESDGSFQ